ncbi:hypothetical protein [Sphaerochaeta globosa]|uniref:Outer membrane protein beta-barrel domain-containing protein n=1 Tax=Sphaerochaeta globosa (strain ATCC BAA-1886 / DSM 22777 / Buddy) TaxID=158189 RepID=F0RRQ1_SPHGB|nr:hypothetical protein [Sphaerochaeta globosa]ADY14310.1 hypothetical protein SpiBuddy_2497 [Sphaerochaeta globosa str. Buddy]
MKLSVRTAVCTALLLLASSLSIYASASPLPIVIKPTSEQVVAIRYQTGHKAKGPWKEVNADHPILSLQAFDSIQDVLFVQQKEPNKGWSRSYEYRYDEQTNSWDVTLPTLKKPLFIDSMELKPYALFPTNSSSTLYSSVIGGAVKFNLSVDEHKPLYGYVEGAYSRGPSKSDWVNVMQAVNISAGFGYRIRLGKSVDLAPEAGYGLVLHILDGDQDLDGTDSLEVFVDQQARLALTFSYTFCEAHAFFIAPLGVMFFEKSRVAALYGVQAGMRFNF